VKTCKQCDVEKTFDHFIVKGKYIDGSTKYHSWCDPCRLKYNAEKNRKWRETKGAKPVEKPKNYLSNTNLHCEMIVSIAAGRLTRPASNMFQLITNNVSRKFRYKNEDDRADCKQEALYQLHKNWMSYDPDKTDNAFAWATEVAKRAMAKAFNDLNKWGDSYEGHLRMDVLYDDSDGWDKI
jgi:hypothetical protein